MRHITIAKHIALIAILLTGMLCAHGQREKNNIYLFDCTGSMKTNQLWEPAKSALYATIAAQATIPGSQFCIIPFGDNPYQNFVFDSHQYSSQKGDIEDAFNQYVSQAHYTRISDVLKTAFQKIDPNKDNKIYLLTDGIPNGGDSPENVAKTISNWCSDHRNSRLFYVALTLGVINPVIRQAIDACPDAFIVQCEDKVIPQLADISPTHIHTNLQELNRPREIMFSLPGTYGLKTESKDSLFDVHIKNNSASSCKILVTLSPRQGLDSRKLHQLLQGAEHVFPITLQCTDSHYFIANPNVSIHVSDQIISTLNIAQGVDELYSDGVQWHDSFLWSPSAADPKVLWDLSPEFKNYLQNSRLDLKFSTGEGQPDDFQAWYNGQPINNGGIITIMPGRPAMLQVQFNHDADTGKRYFSLTPTHVESLNIINGQNLSDYTGTSLRTNYDVIWNPLKTLLFWLAIVLLAGLVLWFVLLRRLVFPAIKMSKIIMTGPGSYFASKKIKGARKVVLTSKRQSQNIISRLFTGEIRYVKAEQFTPAIIIRPAGGKKKVNLSSEGTGSNSWDIYPSSIFSQYDEGTLANRNTGDKTEIEFN